MSFDEALEHAKKQKESAQQEAPGELMTGVLDSIEDDMYLVYYEPENRYIPTHLSDELSRKPVIGDRVEFRKAKIGFKLLRILD